ncbi:chloride channel [Spinellus fusiger]|nr:chloride channel [Spinellus fusiger]
MSSKEKFITERSSLLGSHPIHIPYDASNGESSSSTTSPNHSFSEETNTTHPLTHTVVSPEATVYDKTSICPPNEQRKSHSPSSIHKRARGQSRGQMNMGDKSGLSIRSENYSSIDMIRDRIKEATRQRKLNSAPGLRGRWEKALDASQAWILVIIIGVTVAEFAWCIDVVQEWLSDIKKGYCTMHWQYNEQFCCWGKEEHEACPEWREWSDVFGVENEVHSYYTAMAVYTAFGLVFSLLAALMVKYSAEKLIMRIPATPLSKKPSTIFPSTHDNSEDLGLSNQLKDFPATRTITKTAYYSAGSGIPEVKVILSGFSIKGFLGIKTLLVKSIGMILSTSSGLTCGKEGPFVHLACSVANIASRFFPKFCRNESKKREILSAAAASGVAVAFGAPMGGVLFSLEEVSYYFPSKTMIRCYCCAMVAATVLKITNPFGTRKIVMFEVHYDKEYHIFELIPFALSGILAGFLGACTVYCNIKFQYIRKETFIGKYPLIEVMCIMLLTASISFWNPFTRLDLSAFAANLFSECSEKNDNGGLCAKTIDDIPNILYLLITALFIKIFLTIITFGCRVPGGVFLPGLIIGAVTGRIVGLVMQYITLSFPDAWPFLLCAQDMASHGKCVIPGVYALTGAAAGLTGVTRSTVSLVVIMFELTNSLTYALPIMIAVMTAKWTSDSMFPSGIYDLLIELQNYPYLESNKAYQHTVTVLELAEEVPTIDLNTSVSVDCLHQKMKTLSEMGYGTDGGIPILCRENTLQGYVSTYELSYALKRLSKQQANASYPYHHDARKTDVYFMANKLHSPHNDSFSDNTSSCVQRDEEHSILKGNDFSPYVDYAPAIINESASMEMLVDMFVKMGACYLCVVDSHGTFLGVIYKRRLIVYLKELEEK